MRCAIDHGGHCSLFFLLRVPTRWRAQLSVDPRLPQRCSWLSVLCGLAALSLCSQDRSVLICAKQGKRMGRRICRHTLWHVKDASHTRQFAHGWCPHCCGSASARSMMRTVDKAYSSRSLACTQTHECTCLDCSSTSWCTRSATFALWRLEAFSGCCNHRCRSCASSLLCRNRPYCMAAHGVLYGLLVSLPPVDGAVFPPGVPPLRLLFALRCPSSHEHWLRCLKHNQSKRVNPHTLTPTRAPAHYLVERRVAYTHTHTRVTQHDARR